VPIPLPVWFVTIGERIYLSGPGRTKKFVRVRHDPRCSFLIESGERWSELQGVLVTGKAHLVTDPKLLARVADALSAKYAAYRTRRSAMPDATKRHYEVEQATVEIIPDDRILSWDNARLNLG